MALIFRFPQVCPGSGSLFDKFLVVHDTGNAPDISQGVLFVGVISRMLQIFGDIGSIRKLALIQFFQHVQLDHGGHHVIGRLDDIELGAAGLHLGQQFLVVGVYVVGYLAVELLFKVCDNLGRIVIRPAINVQDLFVTTGAAFFIAAAAAGE